MNASRHTLSVIALAIAGCAVNTPPPPHKTGAQVVIVLCVFARCEIPPRKAAVTDEKESTP
jgi:hypothetical protein